ncbi:hypothetical protein BsIDN1_36100 [Bacillus safensis]|uniref:ABC transmembrane type-1 domain-containing protein n=1 Tax=Bacillus safensis TaxID=561879 RepID=A0A5S9MBM0_BACIA|nr:hypothetical protein BsIDN1_36100 [Bacillus safensis]
MKSILSFLKPYRLSVVSIVILFFLSSMLQLYLPTLTADIVDVGIVQGRYCLHMEGWRLDGGLFFTRHFAHHLEVLLVIKKTALGFGRDMRRQLFVHVEQFSLEEFQKIGTSSFITRSTNDVKQVQDVTIMILQMMTRAPLMLVGGIILAVSRDAVLSLIFLAALPFLADSSI